MSAFIKSIQNTAHQYSLWEQDTKILVAVSGGPDSMCLLHVLIFLSKKYNFTLHVAHINYGIRTKDALLDEELVRSTAYKYDLPISVLRPNFSGSKNIEEQLRIIRYDFFEKIRAEHNLDVIAIAHNQNDQAETLLLNLLRGSGLKGLGAMQHKNHAIIRPLLDVARENIMKYVKYTDIPYRIDKSNHATIFFRNKIRNKLLPYLQKNYNPNIQKTLAQTAIILSDDYTKLTHAETVTYIPYISDNNGIHFDSDDFLLLDNSSQRQFLRDLIQITIGSLNGITLPHIQEITKLISSKKSKTKKHSFRKVIVAVKGSTVTLSKNNG